MKVTVEVDGEILEVEILGHEGTRWRVRVAGEERVLDVVGGHALHEGRSIPFELTRDAHGAPIAIRVRGQEFSLGVEGPHGTRRPGSRRSGGAARELGGRVTAPMNGQVVKVLHAPGDSLQKGDVVLVLEAMKMENEVTAPIAGRLARVDVQPGATVKPGDPLFEMEPVP